ncbi:MAG: type II toxin-antitoxin system VapC family toxin [Acidobacteriota bacterium]
MIGLDTAVLVRYLTQDHPAQSRAAGEVIEGAAGRGERLGVAAVTLCELVWVLESAYGRDRADIGAALEQLARTADVELEHAELVRQAIAAYRAGRVDFADVLVGLVNEAAGCEVTVTFDKALRRLPQFRVL